MAAPYLFSPRFFEDVDRGRDRRGSATPQAPTPRTSTSQSAEDTALLARLRGGDEAAFEQIFRTHTPAMYRAAAALLGAHDPAADVVQAVMHRLWMQRDRLTVRGVLGAYLCSATVNATRNTIRGTVRGRAWAERAAVTLADVARNDSDREDPDCEDALTERRIAMLEHAIAQLPDRTREIFLLWWNGELSYRDIAQATGISVKGVERARSRALDMLRRALIEAGLGPDQDEVRA